MSTTKIGQAEQDQAGARRKPRQARALYKIGLILEATMRLLEHGDTEALNTNAIAELAGVSIGTIYQYFDGKQAILDMLVDQELGEMIDGILAVLSEPMPDNTGDRIRRVVRVVSGAFGGRSRVHQQLIQHSLTRGRSAKLRTLYKTIVDLMVSPEFAVPGKERQPLTQADAFVVTYAIAGVMRALIAQADSTPSVADVEQSLVRLIVPFTERR